MEQARLRYLEEANEQLKKGQEELLIKLGDMAYAKTAQDETLKKMESMLSMLLKGKETAQEGTSTGHTLLTSPILKANSEVELITPVNEEEEKTKNAREVKKPALEELNMRLKVVELEKSSKTFDTRALHLIHDPQITHIIPDRNFHIWQPPYLSCCHI